MRGAFTETILELARDRALHTLRYCIEEADHILANAQNLPEPMLALEYCDRDDHFCLLVDVDGRIVYANEMASAVFDRPTTALHGRCMYALAPRERAEPRKQIVEAVVASGQTYQYIDTDGLGRWYDARFVPLRKNGAVHQVVILALALEAAPEPLAVRIIQ